MSCLPGAGLGFAPWRLSGVVYGCALNDPAVVAALGDAVNQPPYKTAPRAPVLYVKPRNSLASNGTEVPLPADVPAFEVGATLGIVIGRTACRVAVAGALEHVAGWTLVADLGVPVASHYRPNVRAKARDRSCLLGPQVVPRAAVAAPDSLTLEVSVDDGPPLLFSTGVMRRPVAQLLADVSEFMTLQPGDLLLLGVAAGAPLAGAGQRFAIQAAGLGRLEGRLVAEAP